MLAAYVTDGLAEKYQRPRSSGQSGLNFAVRPDTHFAVRPDTHFAVGPDTHFAVGPDTHFAVGPDTRKGCHYISASKTYLD